MNLSVQVKFHASKISLKFYITILSYGCNSRDLVLITDADAWATMWRCLTQ